MSLVKLTGSPRGQKFQVNWLPLCLRTKPWLHFKLKKVTFDIVLVFFLCPRFWRFWVFSDNVTLSNWRHAVGSPAINFSIYSIDSPWKVVSYRVFDCFNTICQCLFYQWLKSSKFSKKLISMWSQNGPVLQPPPPLGWPDVLYGWPLILSIEEKKRKAVTSQMVTWPHILLNNF